jgi:hypothetical protein
VTGSLAEHFLIWYGPGFEELSLAAEYKPEEGM